DPSVHRALLDHAARVPAFQASLLDAADEDLLVQALLRPELREAALTRPVEALVPRLAARLPRPEAVWVLARIGSEQAWSAILSAGSFNSALPQADPARLARVALHWAADRERGPLLARLLPARPEYADFFRAALAVPEARAAACAAIRQLKDREAVPKLIPLLREDREVTYTLHSVTGEQFGLDRQAWWRWWHEATRKL
ncbi:MAG TPA: hypothetical protein VMU54_00615, partial [Planctomycetota bacterium]|nr:hypothetical protein [Planctomycetota bacterium]